MDSLFPDLSDDSMSCLSALLSSFSFRTLLIWDSSIFVFVLSFSPSSKTEFWFSVLLFLSVLAYVNGQLMSNPRVIYAMSEDGVLPKALQRKNDKTNVLVLSLTVFAAICVVVLFFADTFEKILSFSIFLDSFGMATSAATLFMLRKRTRHLDGTGIYKMKFFPLQPIIFIAAYSFVCISISINTPHLALIGLGVLIAFILIYWLFMRKQTDNNR